MSWKKTRFQNFKLYAVTAVNPQNKGGILEKIDAAYAGGADIVQLRSKSLTDSEFLALGREAKKSAEKHHGLLFVNDRLDLALAMEADGLHVGQEDLPVASIKEICRRQKMDLRIGKSTHSPEQAQAAFEEGVDYIGVGPVFETPTKPGRPAVGLEFVRWAEKFSRLPFVAIGGIDFQNIQEVLNAGAKRIAVVRAIFSAPDVAKAAAQMVSSIEEFLHEHA